VTLRVFYFSGTGNARNVAVWLAAAWAERGREVAVAEIARTDPATVRLGPEDELALISPTHGFNFPPITLGFLLRLPRAAARNRALVVNTRAGVRFFGVALPGLSGIAQLLAALTLLVKGYRVVGMRPMDLPSNWLALHPGLRADNVAALHARGEAKTRRFAARILDGGRDYRALWDLPQDLLIAPIAVGYYFVGRFLLAKSFVASRDCDGCGACVSGCPLKAIRLEAGRPFWSYRCESCMRCMNACPRRAIETAHGFVAVALVLSFVVVKPAVFDHVAWLNRGGLLPTLARNVVSPALTLAVVLLGYRVLHRLLGVGLVERLTTLTSLTRFRWWRRYRAPRV
jgi:hypothetical protein